jgi:hypothetical protein
MGRESREVWIERVERWRASGQTAKAFAEANDVNVWTLRGWSERLTREGGTAGSQRSVASSRGRARVARAEKTLPFVEVIASSVIESSGDRFEVALRENCRLYIPARFDAEALRRLLAVLEER